MQRPTVGEIDEIDSAEPERRRRGSLAQFGDAGAQHATLPDVFAVLIVEIMRTIERAEPLWPDASVRHRPIPSERPAIETARSPAHAVQRAVVGVVDDGADVIRETEDFG